MTDSLRIALFTYSTKPRGSVIHTLELAEALHKLGHHVCVYALDKDGAGFHRPLACDYRLVPTRSLLGNTDQIIQQRIQEFVDYLSHEHLQNHSYDCYHAQDCISANALARLRQQGLIPHFLRTVHHIDTFNSPYLQECQERSIQEPDRCLCVSKYWQTELRQHYQIVAPQIINGVNTERFSPKLDVAIDRVVQHQFGLLDGFPIYLTVGGIEPRKNSIKLLQAYAQVLSEYPNARLVIVGGETLFDYQAYRNDFFAVANDLGIFPGWSLTLLGTVSDAALPALYRAADAFVFPSVKEGWGLVVLEAIASGLPVLTSNQPPFTEFLTNQQALLIDPSSFHAIAQAMLKIVEFDVAHSLIQQSQSICKHYTWENSAKMHLEQYKSFQMLGSRCQESVKP